MRGWLLALALCLPAAAQERRSGFDDMARETQAMQADDSSNPGMLWVLEGEALWATGCARCHGDAASMRGVAARYPAWDEASRGPLDLAGRIVAHNPMARESQPLLALAAFVAHQSRGLPIASADDARLAPALARGAALYAQRRGQLDLSCAQCHDDNAGRRLAGSVIPQAHPTGYPIYRLEWQGVGSLQAPAARLHYGRALRALRLWRGRVHRNRAVPDAARGRDAGGDAGGPAVKPGAWRRAR